jgi:glycosyltransferase involved in cell wall biosynthesis
MKILFITSLLGKEYGGAEVSMRLLRERLIEEGCEVPALTTRKSPSDKTLISIAFPIEVPKKLLTLGNGAVDHFLAKKIKKQIETVKPDVIHIQDTFILPAAIKANESFNVPAVVTIRNSVLDETWALMFSYPISKLLKWRNKTIIGALHKVDYIISVSEYIKTELIQRGITGKKIIPIYNLPPNVNENLRNQQQNNSHSIIQLLALGQLEAFKGFSILIRSMKLIIATDSNVHLIIVGDGSKKKKLEKLTKELQLECYIDFIGKVHYSELSQRYLDCDIVIFPSIYSEPFGRVALEAMSFGKPVIASKVGGIPEVVEDKKCGLLVTPNNPEELAEAITQLIRAPLLRQKYGEYGRVLVGTKFNEKEITAAHLNIYRSAVDNPKIVQVKE